MNIIKIQNCYHATQGTVGSEMTSDEDLSSLKLRFLWNKPRSILETPPGYANIELLAKLSFIDDRLACCDMFKDIELLQGYKSGLENQGESLRNHPLMRPPNFPIYNPLFVTQITYALKITPN